MVELQACATIPGLEQSLRSYVNTYVYDSVFHRRMNTGKYTHSSMLLFFFFFKATIKNRNKLSQAWWLASVPIPVLGREKQKALQELD